MTGPADDRCSGPSRNQLFARRSGIDTRDELVVYMRADCPVCRSAGIRAHARVLLRVGDRSGIATVHHFFGDLFGANEAALSEAAWHRLDPKPGELVTVEHPAPLLSMSAVRAKILRQRLPAAAFGQIVRDLAAGRYSDIEAAAFLTACAAHLLDAGELKALTEAMVDAGDTMRWDTHPIADKHCVGGLPGNRTTPIVVAIMVALGVTIPKTSSRAITSPAGTADMMETLAPVELDVPEIRRVVREAGGCIVWGGAVRLSPADDLLIRVERVIDLDSEAQLVASVLSKKIAAGASHVIIDIPVGPTAKVRDDAAAKRIAASFRQLAGHFGLKVRTLVTDGRQPIGRGIGPALEARDVLAVLRGAPDAPADLKDKSVRLAAALLELIGQGPPTQAAAAAERALKSGEAWNAFQRICAAQGGFREPPTAAHKREILAEGHGTVTAIDNRKLARIAKLAGAPDDKAAGVVLHAQLGDRIEADQPVFTIHAETPGGLGYALSYATQETDVVRVEKVE